MSADLLTQLIAAGTPAHLVAEVAMLAAQAAAAEQRIADAVDAALSVDRRSADAIKQQRYRDRLKADGVTRRNDVTKPVTRYGSGNAEPSPAPSPLPPPCTPHQPHAPTPTRDVSDAYARGLTANAMLAVLIAGCQQLAEPKGRGKQATRMTEGWQPRQPYPDTVAALVALWPPGREQRELEGFRDYWLTRSRDAARTDWDRTWWNRIRDKHDTIIRENRHGQRNHNDWPKRDRAGGGFRDPLLRHYAGGADPQLG